MEFATSFLKPWIWNDHMDYYFALGQLMKKITISYVIFWPHCLVFENVKDTYYAKVPYLNHAQDLYINSAL